MGLSLDKIMWKCWIVPIAKISYFINHTILKREDWYHIHQFTKKHAGELLLDVFSVVKLIGWAETNEDYYYLILKDIINEYGKNTNVICLSCVIDIKTLKRDFPHRAYARLEQLWKWNHPLDSDVWKETREYINNIKINYLKLDGEVVINEKRKSNL